MYRRVLRVLVFDYTRLFSHHLKPKSLSYVRSLIVFAILLLSVINTTNTSAASSTLTLSISSGTVSLNIVAMNATGTFASSNDLSISANTNNYSGYTLSISSSTNNTVLTGPLNPATNTNEVLNSIGTVSGVTNTGISASDFSNSSNTQYNNTWGYKPSKRNSSNNSNFLPAPSTSGDVIESTSAANSNNTPNNYTVSIGARITPSTQTGVYSNTFIIAAVANLISYSIAYNANDGNSGQDTINMPTPNPQTGNVDTTTTTVTLSNKTPVRTGYDFMGWCTVQVADDAACSGSEYQPSGSYNIDYLNANSFTLYARWERAVYDLTVDFAGTGVSSVKVCTVSGDCSGNNLKGTITTSGGSVEDLSRNTTYYLYATFPTNKTLGNWKKTSGAGTLVGATEKNTTTTNNNPTFTTANGDTTITVTGRAVYMQEMTIDDCPALESWPFTDSRDGQSYTVAILNDGSCWMTQNLRLGSDGNQITLTSSDSDVSSNFTFTSSSSWSNIFTSSTINQAKAYYSNDLELGSYYNWYTATAGTGTSSTAAKVDASGSICPKGWVLPSKTENQKLAYNVPEYQRGTKLMSPSLPNRVYSGGYSDTTFYNFRSFLWSRTAASTSTTYDVVTVANTAWEINATPKYFGEPIRCRLANNKTSFTVNLNANDGSGNTSSQSATNANTVALDLSPFSRSGYTFVGWSTDSNATEPMYIDGSPYLYSYKDTLDLYAVWKKENAITFTFDGADSLIILDADGKKITTISSSGDSAMLPELSSFVIRPTKGVVDTATVVSGAGTIDRTSTNEVGFSLGKGVATINVSGTEVTTSLQSLTKANCQSLASSGNYNVYDERDGEVYSVRYINTLCWMTQNLRFTGTFLSTTTSNVGTNKTLTYNYDFLASNFSNATISDSGSTDIGVWYNFAAASALYITGDSNTSNSSYDICPKNWHLPTGPGTTSGRDFNKLVGNTTAGQQSFNTNITAFAPSTGGYYQYTGGDGINYAVLSSGDRAGYWSATYRGQYSRYYLNVTQKITGENYIYSPGEQSYMSRWVGFFVRCVRTT